MNARTKLNEIFIGGAVMAALIVGLMFQSMPLAVVFGGLLLVVLIHSGDVRLQQDQRTRSTRRPVHRRSARR